MYKTLTIGGKDYKLEYTIEASLYGDCIEKLITFISKTAGATEVEKTPKGMTDEEIVQYKRGLMQNAINGISNIPDTALTLFYAGLMEYHGEDGDRTILSKRDAKALLKTFFKEEEEKENGCTDFTALIALCMEQMGEDDFFRKTGLEKVLAPNMAGKNSASRRAAAKASGE